MRFAIVIICFLWASTSYAGESLCPDFEKKKGVWHIPESAFTQSEANKALNNLKHFTNKGVKGVDFVSIKNDLIIIRGFMYKQALETYEKEFGKKDTSLLKEFCQFLKEEAYTRH